MDIFSEYFVKIGSQFIDPKKRVFIAYIVISIFIALGWFILNKNFSFKAWSPLFEITHADIL